MATTTAVDTAKVNSKVKIVGIIVLGLVAFGIIGALSGKASVPAAAPAATAPAVVTVPAEVPAYQAPAPAPAPARVTMPDVSCRTLSAATDLLANYVGADSVTVLDGSGQGRPTEVGDQWIVIGQTPAGTAIPDTASLTVVRIAEANVCQ